MAETIKVNLLGRPTAFARKEINKNGTMDEKSREYFMHLVHLKKKKYNQDDISREKFLETKRSVTMEKLQHKLDMKRAYDKRQNV